MTIAGNGGGDVVRQFTANVVNLIKKKRPPGTATCDGDVLKLHYKYTFWMFLGGFSAVWYSWYHRDVIVCSAKFNADAQVRVDYINLCLSYIFKENEMGERSTLVFYRWVSFFMLFMACVYYIPHKISKKLENQTAKKLLEDIAGNSFRYDSIEHDLVDRAAKWIISTQPIHNSMFKKYVIANIVALGIDVFCWFMCDFVLKGKFITYGWMAYPYTRDPVYFQDYMSRTFPPFAKCELTPVFQILGERTEIYGCNLTLMELYDKIFLFLWFWLVILTTITIGYIFFLLLFCIPYTRMTLLRMAKPQCADRRATELVCDIAQNYSVGTFFILYCIKFYTSDSRFYELLRMLDDDEYVYEVTHGPAEKSQVISNRNGNRDLRHRNQ